MMNSLRVAVLFGGKSSEYEVSLRSAAFVLQSLSAGDYEIIPIGITRQGVWKLYRGDRARIPVDQWDSPDLPVVFVRPGCADAPFAYLENGALTAFAVDVAFPVLHGKNGEDGTVQGMLQLAEVPCVGCACDATAVCMNKSFTHGVLETARIRTAPWETCTRRDLERFDALEADVRARFGYPMFVKPARAGSSVGVSKAHDKSELRRAIEVALDEDCYVLIEQALVGSEVECAVLGNHDLIAVGPAEIIPAAEFYDYAAKYDDIGSEVIIPARLSAALTENVLEVAKAAYRALQCRGMARVDMFAADDGRVFVNEVNTLPGFTAISGYPKMMEYGGWNGEKLCAELIRLALEA